MNEYKIKYNSIEEFRQMTFKKMQEWEEQLEEIELCLNRFVEMESFQGEAAEAIRQYIQEVHATLLAGIRQAMKEYRVKLLLYQKGYDKIDSNEKARLPQGEIQAGIKHMKQQKAFFESEEIELSKILFEIRHIAFLLVPDKTNLFSVMDGIISKSEELDSSIEAYEYVQAGIAEGLEGMIKSVEQVIRIYLQQERTITEYAPESFETLAEAENLREQMQASVWYIQGKKPDLQEEVRNRLKGYQQQLEEQEDLDVDGFVDVLDYVWRSLKQVGLGNFTEDVTLLGTVGQLILALTGLDFPCDIRDITADITELIQGEEVPAWQVLLDLVAFIPAIGLAKYGDETVDILKGAGKSIDDGAKWISGGKKLEKGMGDASETLQKVGEGIVEYSLENESGKDSITVSQDRLQHSVLGEFNSNGRLINGGHGQANIDFLNQNNIEYNIVKVYDNGVRVGIIKNNGKIGTIIPDNSRQP